ncbi:hypothetical protein PITC_040070 [Penicillium italicum]|uniref:Uncharacterized protein n=1 Tax=Penicillium italicum TaxID=40296 RepID=A0A0A2L1P1_PENIT|nr:hypothetical protein PITC_040070 [Penicillium italicum]
MTPWASICSGPGEPSQPIWARFLPYKPQRDHEGISLALSPVLRSL